VTAHGPTAGPAPAAAGAGPPRAGGRLVGVDATRGLALLGMMAVHVFPAHDPDGSTSTAYLIASGRSAATFAVLAGVGLALATGGQRPPTGRDRTRAAAALLARALAIGTVGLLLGYVESGVAVILVYYALLFVLAIPLLGLRPGPLAAVAATAAVTVPVASQALRDHLPEPLLANPILDWALVDPVELFTELAVTGYYPALAWTTYLAAGMAVGRLPLRSARVAGGLVVGGAALAVGASALSWLLLGPLGGRAAIARTTTERGAALDRMLSEVQYGTTPTRPWWWLAVDAPHSTTPLDLLHTTGTALVLLGLMLLLARLAGRLLRPLAAAGSMTLTLYTLHVVALSTGALPPDPATSYVGQVGAAMLGATLWRATAGRGPLERAVGALAERARRAVR